MRLKRGEREPEVSEIGMEGEVERVSGRARGPAMHQVCQMGVRVQHQMVLSTYFLGYIFVDTTFRYCLVTHCKVITLSYKTHIKIRHIVLYYIFPTLAHIHISRHQCVWCYRCVCANQASHILGHPCSMCRAEVVQAIRVFDSRSIFAECISC